MLNILITGSDGQLGQSINEISSEYEYNFIFANKDSLNILNEKDIEIFINKYKINCIINCASYTNVDKAENDKKIADDINHQGIKILGKLSKINNIKLIHISSDYVFDGKNFQPYKEKDKTLPCSVYGQTKLDGEKALITLNIKNSIIIRTSWLYSKYANNFLKTILNLSKKNDKLNIVYDQIGTPTYALDLAKIILDILPTIENKSVEIYHYSNEGVASWYDFTKEIIKIQNIKCLISPIESHEYKTLAKRPHYSILSKTKIKTKFDIIPPYWKDSLIKCLKEIK